MARKILNWLMTEQILQWGREEIYRRALFWDGEGRASGVELILPWDSSLHEWSISWEVGERRWNRLPINVTKDQWSKRNWRVGVRLVREWTRSCSIYLWFCSSKARDLKDLHPNRSEGIDLLQIARIDQTTRVDCYLTPSEVNLESMQIN